MRPNAFWTFASLEKRMRFIVPINANIKRDTTQQSAEGRRLRGVGAGLEQCLPHRVLSLITW